MRDGVAVPRRTVVLTFDDGTQDVYTNAWPIMQRNGDVGTFYLITSRTYRRTVPGAYYMSRPQAADLAAAGNEIGNHTRDHDCLRPDMRPYRRAIGHDIPQIMLSIRPDHRPPEGSLRPGPAGASPPRA